MTDLLIRKMVNDFPYVLTFPQYILTLLCNAYLNMTDLLIRKTVNDFPNIFTFPQYTLPLLCNAS